MKKEKVLLLCSGGFDSIVLLNCLVEGGREVVSVFFDYGQRNLEFERSKAKNMCDKLGSDFIEVKIPTFNWSTSSLFGDDNLTQYVPMRNLIFLSYAVSLAESLGISKVYTAFIALSVGGRYFSDNSPKFVKRLNKVIKDVGIEIRAPLKKHTKGDLALEVKKFGITRDDFFSCNLPTPEGDPCGKCEDCEILDMIYNIYVHY